MVLWNVDTLTWSSQFQSVLSQYYSLLHTHMDDSAPIAQCHHQHHTIRRRLMMRDRAPKPLIQWKIIVMLFQSVCYWEIWDQLQVLFLLLFSFLFPYMAHSATLLCFTVFLYLPKLSQLVERASLFFRDRDFVVRDKFQPWSNLLFTRWAQSHLPTSRGINRVASKNAIEPWRISL